MRYICLLLSVVLFVGCSQFDMENDTTQAVIPNNYGLVLLRVNADGRNVALRILNVETSELIDDAFKGAAHQSNLTMLSLPAGKYTIARVDQTRNDGIFKFDVLDKQLNFVVLRGRSTYLGDLVVKLPHNQINDYFMKKTRNVTFYYSSNLLEVHEFMEDNYPEILSRFPLVAYPMAQ